MSAEIFPDHVLPNGDLAWIVAHGMQSTMDQALGQTSPRLKAELIQQANREGLEAGHEYLQAMGQLLVSHEGDGTNGSTPVAEAIALTKDIMVNKQTLAYFATTENFGGNAAANYDIAGRVWARLEAFNHKRSIAKESGLTILVWQSASTRRQGVKSVDLSEVVSLLDFYHTTKQHDEDVTARDILGLSWRDSFVDFLDAFVETKVAELKQADQTANPPQISA